MISFVCPSCRHPLSVQDEFSGKRDTCPQCKQPLVVPEAMAVSPGAVPVGSPNPEAVTASADAPPYVPACASRFDFMGNPQAADELFRLGSYRILKVLGFGGMGMVFLADDPALKRPVALKVMRPELAADPTARQRFLREAQLTAAIDHPHIVPIHQVAEANDVPFIVMPLLKGEPLDARLKQGKRLAIADVLRIGKQVAEGLAEAHKNGLIHRDIKPANIWLSGEPGAPATEVTVKIVDFGLARGGAGDDVQLTRSGAILGTPAFMAPEQARGTAVDFRCDLFSLGAVLYRMLTGELPFRGRDTMAMLLALTTDTPQPVDKLNPEVPPALARLVMQLLAKEPAQRPPSAIAVAETLGELLTMPAPMAGSPRKTAFLAFAIDAGKQARARLWSLRPWAFRRPRLAFAVEGTILALLVLLISLALLRERAQQAARPEQTDPAVHDRRVQAELLKVLKPDESDIDLVHAALLIAKLDNPELDVDAYRRAVDRMARSLQAAVPKNADEPAKLAALNRFLFTEQGFHGFRGDATRSNSYLNKVLDSREGLPITLSVLYIELARRIGLSLAGVGMPGHFIVKTLPTKGEPTLIDVVDAGKVLTREEAAKKVEAFTKAPLRDEHLAATTKRQIIVRILHNLLVLSVNQPDLPSPLRYLDTILTVAPDEVEDHWLRAQFRAKSGERQGAIEDADWLLRQNLGETDLKHIQEFRQQLERE